MHETFALFWSLKSHVFIYTRLHHFLLVETCCVTLRPCFSAIYFPLENAKLSSEGHEIRSHDLRGSFLHIIPHCIHHIRDLKTREVSDLKVFQIEGLCHELTQKGELLRGVKYFLECSTSISGLVTAAS